jgi:hypothetical protein
LNPGRACPSTENRPSTENPAQARSVTGAAGILPAPPRLLDCSAEGRRDACPPLACAGRGVT